VPVDYAPKEALAQRLIDNFGAAGTLHSNAVDTDYNPTETITDIPCKMVVMMHQSDHVDGTTIQAGDKMIYLSTEGLTTAPKLSDEITAPDGLKYTIVPPLAELKPTDLTIFYTLNGRS